MADEELHETDSNDQKDWQGETSSEAATDDAAKSENAADETAAEDENYGVDMEKVEAVLNATWCTTFPRPVPGRFRISALGTLPSVSP